MRRAGRKPEECDAFPEPDVPAARDDDEDEDGRSRDEREIERPGAERRPESRPLSRDNGPEHRRVVVGGMPELRIREQRRRGRRQNEKCARAGEDDVAREQAEAGEHASMQVAPQRQKRDDDPEAVARGAALRLEESEQDGEERKGKERHAGDRNGWDGPCEDDD